MPDPPKGPVSKQDVIKCMCQFMDEQMSPTELAKAALKVYVLVAQVFCGPGTDQLVLRTLTDLKFAAMSRNERDMCAIVKQLIDLVCDMEPYVAPLGPPKRVSSNPIAPPKQSRGRVTSRPVEPRKQSTWKADSEPIAPPKQSTWRVDSEPVEPWPNPPVIHVHDSLLRRKRPNIQSSYRNRFEELRHEESANDSGDLVSSVGEEVAVHSLPSPDFGPAHDLKVFLDRRTNGITQSEDAQELRNLISQLSQVSRGAQWQHHLGYLDRRTLVPLQYLVQIRNDLRLCE